MARTASLTMALLGALPLIAAPVAAIADEVAEVAQFYTGKTVSIIVNVEVGGLYSSIGGIIARHLGGHIPGRPNVIVQHMPGAGGSVAAAFAYTVAAKDGTILFTPNTGMPLRVPLGLDKPVYDAAKFTWLGGWGEGISTVTLKRDIAPATSIEEARHKEVILGAIGKTSNTYLVPALMNNMLGTKFRMITGYRGGAPIRLAMEKGEVHGWSGQLEGWKSLSAAGVNDPNLIHLIQLASKPSRDLPGVPMLSTFARNDEERTILSVIESGIADRGIVLPPGVPPARVAALGKAYQDTLRSPAFVKEATAAKFDIEPIDGPTIQNFVKMVAELPKDTIAKIRKAMEID